MMIFIEGTITVDTRTSEVLINLAHVRNFEANHDSTIVVFNHGGVLIINQSFAEIKGRLENAMGKMTWLKNKSGHLMMPARDH